MAIYDDPESRTLPGGDTGVGQPWFMYDPNRPPGGGAPGTGTSGGGGVPGPGDGANVPGVATDGITASGPGFVGSTAPFWTNPLTWLTLGGMLWNIFGQLKAGAAQKAINEFNARMSEMRANDAIIRGEEDESRYRQGVRALIGSQRAGFAAQNVDVGQGSPADVQADAAFLGELDALTIRTNAAREAWGYRVDAENYRMAGDLAMTNAQFGAVGTAIAGGTSLLQARYGWGRRI